MTESEAIEKLKNMRLFMQIEDENNDCKFTEDDYKANDMAIKALEKQIPKKPMMAYDDKVDSNWCSCPICANGIGWEIHARKIKFCLECGQRLDFGDDEK